MFSQDGSVFLLHQEALCSAEINGCPILHRMTVLPVLGLLQQSKDRNTAKSIKAYQPLSQVRTQKDTTKEYLAYPE